MYLDGGTVPARYIKIGNKINFLHYILQEDTELLLLKMLEVQIDHPIKKSRICETKHLLINADRSSNTKKSCSKAIFTIFFFYNLRMSILHLL